MTLDRTTEAGAGDELEEEPYAPIAPREADDAPTEADPYEPRTAEDDEDDEETSGEG